MPCTTASCSDSTKSRHTLSCHQCLVDLLQREVSLAQALSYPHYSSTRTTSITKVAQPQVTDMRVHMAELVIWTALAASILHGTIDSNKTHKYGNNFIQGPHSGYLAPIDSRCALRSATNPMNLAGPLQGGATHHVVRQIHWCWLLCTCSG